MRASAQWKNFCKARDDDAFQAFKAIFVPEREKAGRTYCAAIARTLIAEQMPGVSTDVIEAQLAHGKSGPLGVAYDRAEFMTQRRQLMTAWADYLDKLRAGADVIEIATKRA